MSREQAVDYEDKKKAIMDAAATLFAKVGYPNAQLTEVAKACGATKSMLYHYFKAKDDLLFAILSEHLQEILDAMEKIDPKLSPEKRFREVVALYILKSTETRTRHIVALNDVKYLLPGPQKRVVELERQVFRNLEKVLSALDPKLSEAKLGPFAMSLLGMMSWTDLWYRRSGPMKPTELCDHISELFLHGFLNR